MNKKMVCEKDVRKWLREAMGDNLLWIEHGAGGTVGMPDAMVVCSQRMVPLELKYGGVCQKPVGGGGVKNEFRPFFWKVKMRAGQLAVMRKVVGEGAKFFVLVGSDFYEGLWITCFSAAEHGTKNGDFLEVEPISNGERLMARIGKLLDGGP